MAKPKKFESSGSEPGDGSVRVGTGGSGGSGGPPPGAPKPKPTSQARPPKGASKGSKGA